MLVAAPLPRGFASEFLSSLSHKGGAPYCSISYIPENRADTAVVTPCLRSSINKPNLGRSKDYKNFGLRFWEPMHSGVGTWVLNEGGPPCRK